MTIWRYVAVPLRASGEGPPAKARRVGELAAESRAEVRASLRRIGLQVVELRQVRARRGARDGEAPVEASAGWWSDARRAVTDWIEAWRRARRREPRAEFHDGLATMLASGVPLLETVETLIGSTKRRRSPLRWMLVQIREDLRGGSSLGEAMAAHPTWFEPGEIAMVRAGQHSGTLPAVLRSLAERHERGSELGQKLAGALAYPVIVAIVGVIVFLLSTRTLPDLVKVLVDAGIDPPVLTMNVIALGQAVASRGFVVLLVIIVLAIAASVFAAVAMRRGAEPPRWLRAISPRVLRRMAVARLSLQLSEMLRTGVPIVEALRVLAPTARLVLRRRLLVAADRVERGDELSAALDDEHWFGAEFRRLLEIGQASGELDALLERLGHRYARQARRLIDRLTAFLEPAVILTLAVLVGIVVMAAVLPLLRLQEII